MKQKLEVSQEEAKQIFKNTGYFPDDERPVFLYIKKHNVTGLLYFGRTIQEPYAYFGSGILWEKHLNENGKNVSTIWLRKFENEDDPRLEKMARRISKELNIVESEKFANNCIEKGHNKPNPLPTLEYLQECFEYNADTGELFWKIRPLYHFYNNKTEMKRWNSRYAGKIAGRLNKENEYMELNIEGKIYKVHRIIWKLLKKEEPPRIIDHIDCNRSNNKIENLRKASKSENNVNVIKSTNNKWGFTGVQYDNRKNKFLATIRYKNKTYFLGYYTTAEEASLVYQKKSLELRGEFSTVILAEYEENLKNTTMLGRGVKGYFFIKKSNKYFAHITHNKKRIPLGYFNTAEEASQAYTDAVLKYRGIVM
jgi:hypothetical protein